MAVVVDQDIRLRGGVSLTQEVNVGVSAYPSKISMDYSLVMQIDQSLGDFRKLY